ncbi:MAG: NUDIX hydrolase [Flavobacterium sp.]
MNGDETRKKTVRHYITNKIEIDCVIFNLDNHSLKILLVKEVDTAGKINWRLANDCIKEGETIEGTAHTILKKYTDDNHYFIEQLKAFGYSSRTSLQENIAIAYYALVKRDQSVLEDAPVNENIKWIGINEIADLNDKDKVILDFSLKELRKNSCQSTVAFNLLPEKFTLLQVVHLYEEILGIAINKSNFRRKIFQMGLVKDSNEKEENVSHRAAKYYSLSSQDHEMLRYRELNFNF